MLLRALFIMTAYFAGSFALFMAALSYFTGRLRSRFAHWTSENTSSFVIGRSRASWQAQGYGGDDDVRFIARTRVTFYVTVFTVIILCSALFWHLFACR